MRCEASYPIRAECRALRGGGGSITSTERLSLAVLFLLGSLSSSRQRNVLRTMICVVGNRQRSSLLNGRARSKRHRDRTSLAGGTTGNATSPSYLSARLRRPSNRASETKSVHWQMMRPRLTLGLVQKIGQSSRFVHIQSATPLAAAKAASLLRPLPPRTTQAPQPRPTPAPRLPGHSHTSPNCCLRRIFQE